MSLRVSEGSLLLTTSLLFCSRRLVPRPAPHVWVDAEALVASHAARPLERAEIFGLTRRMASSALGAGDDDRALPAAVAHGFLHVLSGLATRSGLTDAASTGPRLRMVRRMDIRTASPGVLPVEGLMLLTGCGSVELSRICDDARSPLVKIGIGHAGGEPRVPEGRRRQMEMDNDSMSEFGATALPTQDRGRSRGWYCPG